jgi:outer membrane receptor protein involved in Fe transport
VAFSLGELPTPGFTVYTVRSYWRMREGVLFTLGMENIFDKFYREHLDLRTGRGVFQPGRNTYAGLELRY